MGDHPFVSERSEACLTKRWALIQEQCTKFIAACEKMKKRKVSGLGVGDLVVQALGQFKVANGMKNFNMVRCWTTLKDCPKWHDLYVCYDTNAPSAVSAPTKRLRGRASSKAEARGYASSQVVMEAIKTLLDDKEVSSEKRDERKHLKKEESIKNYYEIQTKKLKIEEINARAVAKEVDNKQNELEISLHTEEAKIMTTPMTNDMDLIQRAWLEKNKKIILDRDA